MQMVTDDKLVRITPELHRRLKVAAAATGRSMREIAETAIREYLATLES